MTTREGDSLTDTGEKRLQFDRYVLDMDRGCLLLDDSEIALRPKTFATLHYLVQNCGRLVSKDELFAAVWPGVAVTDDALVQSVGELRRALGDDGPRLIRTIPRRGYRLESNVSAAATMARRSADAEPALATPRDLPHLPERAARVRTGLLISAALAVLLAAGVLWGRIGIEWNSPGVQKSANPPTARSQETGAKPAIAIIPFVNQSDDPAREYFADGLTQDIINALGRFSELTVMSWNAVFPYKGKPASPGEIASNLAVRYQVEGSVRQTGNRVRVIAQLVNTDGRVLWSARFDEAIADLFALQDKITTQIAGALAVRVTQIEQQRVFAKPTESLEAYDYVLRARPALQRPARANIVEARAHQLLSLRRPSVPVWLTGSKMLREHPGSEAFYVLTGRLGQRTPHGVSHVEAGQTMPGHGPGMPMEVFSSGTTELNALVMFFLDATKPFSSPAKFE